MIARSIFARNEDRARALVAALAVASLAICACDGESTPATKGAGDKLIVMVTDADSLSQDQPAYVGDGGAPSPFGTYYGDGGYAHGYGYSPLAVCNQCACEAGTYCFGGGASFTTFSGTCNTGGSTLSVGCQPLPAGCMGTATCGCIFDALKAQVPCYLVCSGQGSLTVYCPHP
jgi:hypothetical protein